MVVPPVHRSFGALNGLEFSCPAVQAAAPSLYGNSAGKARSNFPGARQVCFSELLGRPCHDLDRLMDGDGRTQGLPHPAPGRAIFEGWGDETRNEEAGCGLEPIAVRNQLLCACRHFRLPSLLSGSTATRPSHSCSV
jgi:hypothetical protein